jgi:hypothetical protein
MTSASSASKRSAELGRKVTIGRFSTRRLCVIMYQYSSRLITGRWRQRFSSSVIHSVMSSHFWSQGFQTVLLARQHPDVLLDAAIALAEGVVLAVPVAVEVLKAGAIGRVRLGGVLPDRRGASVVAETGPGH